LIRLALRCRRADADAVLAELLELAPSGVEQVDAPDGRTDVVEFAVYGAPGELPELGEVQAAAGERLVEVRSEPVPADWEERWKRFYHPVLAGGRLYVRPPWERPAERGGVVEVVIDPGRAFGTGTHATTAMCLELIVEEAPRRLGWMLRRPRARSLCDLGCGSGVLAIAASKLGFDPVIAVDSEPAALEESGRNARRNAVELELRRLDLRTAAAPAAEVTVANLTTPLLAEVTARWVDGGRAPGVLIASGFLASEADDVAAAAAGAGLAEKRRLVKGEWAALSCRDRSRRSG
jgi:ribosomal protein L11 methyltransferase